MARFKFRLEAILKLRKLRQEQVERKVARCVGEMLKDSRQCDQLEEQIDQQYRHIRQGGLVGRLRRDSLVGDRQQLNHLHQQLHQKRNDLRKADQLVAQVKQELAQAKKQTDIMVKLKDLAQQRFMKELRRKETAELDDLANAKHAWQRQMAG